MFEVGADKVLTVGGFSRSVAANLGEHVVGSGQPLVEFIAPGADTISFEIMLRADMGVKPAAEADRIIGYCKSGQRFPLFVGRATIGGAGALWICDSVSEEQLVVDNFGNVLQSLVAVNLKLAPVPPVVAASSGTVRKQGVARRRVA